MPVRTTIYLNEDLDARIRQLVPRRGLNRFINELVAEKLAALEGERIVAEMQEGYIATWDDRQTMNDEWEVAATEEWPG